MDTPVNLEPYSQKRITLSELVAKIRRFMRDRAVLNRLIAANSERVILF
jgi:hypothetical protein